MWLINARTYKLESFIGSTVPPYAILSHTWSDDELTFQDMKNPSVVWERSSFAKVRLTCQQALIHDLKYVWVDTCCIDKSSSAELSEAINSSMMRIVLVTGLTNLIPRSVRLLPPALQELIAPCEIRFYANDWTFLSLRSTIVPVLSSITGIARRVLDWRSLSVERGMTLMEVLNGCSVAQRMSWAAKRRTTRSEDVAYSLLGIFGVNMPLLYGEGSKAFARLQTEIIKVSTDHSIFAWSVSESERLGSWQGVSSALLAPHPDSFASWGNVVRTDSMVQIDRSSGHSSAYESTNEGLRISLLILECLRYSYALLDCSLQNDMMGPLALMIIPVPGNPGVYTVWGSGDDGMRLATIPLETIALNVERALITILTSPNVKVTEKASNSTHTYYRVHATTQRARTALVNVWPSEHQEGSSHNGTDFSDDSEVITTISGMSIPDERFIVRVVQFAFLTEKEGATEPCYVVFCARKPDDRYGLYSPYTQHWVSILPAPQQIDAVHRSAIEAAVGAPRSRASVKIGGSLVQARYI
ncbi:hypothetical protein LTR17_007677 [Elasticomyces elasticus]|nr:hypothetical protein LTR17_007677 [Elasticomyces elasticus]